MSNLFRKGFGKSAKALFTGVFYILKSVFSYF